VRDFVREHSGELRFVARGEHEPIVDADEAARQRERIDGGIAHVEELEALRGIARGLRDDARAERLQVFRGFRVLEDLAFLAQLAHYLQADAVLVVERQRGGGGAADVGKVIAGALRERLERRGQRDDGRQQDGQEFRAGSHRGIGLTRRSLVLRQSVSEAKSARRERSPRTSVMWPE
jgi:hypothetical protein